MCLNSQIKKLFVFSIFTFVFLSCLTIRPGAVKAGKNLYVTFFSAKDGTMYYLKPLVFVPQKGSGDLDMDFTFRNKNIVEDTAFLKFSIYSQSVFKTIDSMTLLSGETSISLQNTTHLFSDRANKQYVNRFQTTTNVERLSKAFDSKDWEIIVYHNGEAVHYFPKNKSQKHIGILKKNVFMIL